MSVRVFLLYSWTCPVCGFINQGQHDPREEIVTCGGSGCGHQDEAVDAYDDADCLCIGPNVCSTCEDKAPIRDPRLDQCARTWPHERHVWTGVGRSRPEYHGKTFVCGGIPIPGGAA